MERKQKEVERRMKMVRPIYPKERFAVFVRDGFACRYCGARPPQVRLEVDHIKPRIAGGKNTMNNCITACYECNAGKGTKTLPKKFAPSLERINLAKQFEPVVPEDMVTIRVSPDVHKRLKRLSLKHDISMGDILEKLANSKKL